MVAGRPRTHDRQQIAKDLIDWAKKDGSINLCKFCAHYDPPIPPQKMTQFANESVEFREAYESAKMFIGARREEMLNDNRLHVKAYDLNATTYDYFLKHERRQQAEFEAMLKSQENQGYNPDDVARLKVLMDQVSSLQSSLKNCKNSPSKV